MKTAERSVEVKGVRDGLMVRLSDDPDLDVVEVLSFELAEKQGFLQGSRVTLAVGRRVLDFGLIVALQNLFERHGLTLWAILADEHETRDAARRAGLATRLSGSATDLEGNALPPLEADVHGNGARPLPVANALFLRETLRSGRSIWHEGDVVVLGDVNPGAEVIAIGSVVVWGRLRGLVHAGAGGDERAVICALDLAPTQLRIADHIAVAPDDDSRRPAPEQATVRDGQIIAEPWQPRHLTS